MWRAAKHLLPSNENPWKRKVARNLYVRSVRSNGVENIFHALVTSIAARKVWRLTQFAEEQKGELGQDILSLLHGRVSTKRKVDTEMLVAVCWGI